MIMPLALIALSIAGASVALLVTRVILRVVAQGAAWNSEMSDWASHLGLVGTISKWGTSQDWAGIHRGHNCIVSFVALGAELGSVSPLIQVRVRLDATAMPSRVNPADGSWLLTESRLQELESQLQTLSTGHLRCRYRELVYNIGEFRVSISVLQETLDLMLDAIEAERRHEQARDS